MQNKSVAVAMSGGVDSAAAAILLQDAGYEVSGITLQLHHCKDRPGICGSADDLEDARTVADTLGFSHTVLDYCALFRSAVMDKFVTQYTNGLTPNPCIDCNRRIKFGALFDYVRAQGIDYLATGHYARVGRDEKTGRQLLLRGLDRRKDQSYVLFRLTQEQLSHLLLPAGAYEKPAMRRLAAQHGLLNAAKPDSQDICFVPDGDYVAFLKAYGGVVPVPGDFVTADGTVLGRHRGLVCYTTGQRKGLGISAATPLYVLRKNQAEGTVVLGREEELYSDCLIAEDLNWISIENLTEPLSVEVKTRYSQNEAKATVEPFGAGRVRVLFDAPVRAVTAGQAVVFYRGEVVVGGGTIAP